MELRKIRIERGLGQKEIATMMGVRANTVSQWETGARKLNQDQIVKLAEALEVTTDELLGSVPTREALERNARYYLSLIEHGFKKDNKQ